MGKIERGLFTCSSVLFALVVFSACGENDRSFPLSGMQRVSVDVSSDPIRIETAEARVEVSRSAFRLTIQSSNGELFTRQTATGGIFYRQGEALLELLAVLAARALDDGVDLTVQTSNGQQAEVTIRFLTNRTAEVDVAPPDTPDLSMVGARWESPPDELIYGLTERLRDSPLLSPGIIDIPVEDTVPVEVGSLNRRGEMVEMFIRPTFSLYVPFYQSSRGYGLSVAGTMPGRYDIASSNPEVVSFEFETGTRPQNRRLKLHVFLGPDHTTILDEYTALTGRPFVPPDWAFLNWRWRDELEIRPPADLDGVPINAHVAEDVLMFEELDIPPGVYLFDRPVFPGNFGFARFEWDEERLPNPLAMLDSLHRRGYKLAIWSATWVCGRDPGDNGLEAQQLGFIAPGPPGPPNCANIGGTDFILDVTNPDARAWFGNKLRDFVAEHRIQAIKLDRGEEHIPSDADDIWADGRNGREAHNDYVVLQAELHRNALREAHGNDSLVITRSGYSGTQPFAVFWGGDIPGSESFGRGPGTDLGLRGAIIAQQRAAFMGMPIWGSDTGGYYEFKDRDVFARWIEFSTFSGIMEIGGEGTHAPWDMPSEPNFDVEMIEIYRRYTQLRHGLQAYIVAAAREAGESGMPIVRPLAFLDREDPELQDRWDQYMFGPDLMVAPIWRIRQRSRDVYFPPGTWRSFWNEAERFEGPSTATFDVPLDTILVFIRGGAPSPLQTSD
jgi:alpha-glucosidase (family GH31 glycosyl hydrolase)